VRFGLEPGSLPRRIKASAPTVAPLTPARDDEEKRSASIGHSRFARKAELIGAAASLPLSMQSSSPIWLRSTIAFREKR
jgi:hypothetical protein